MIVIVALTEVNIGRDSLIPDEPVTNIRSRVGIINIPDIATHIAVDIIIVTKVFVVVVTLAAALSDDAGPVVVPLTDLPPGLFGHLFVNLLAVLLGDPLAILIGLLFAVLLGHIATLLVRNIVAVFIGHIVAVLIGDPLLPLQLLVHTLGLGQLLAVVGVFPPFLAPVTIIEPGLFADLDVLISAFGLGVALILSPVLLAAFPLLLLVAVTPLVGFADLILVRATLLPVQRRTLVPAN